MSIVELMQVGLWNLTARTSWPPAWGAALFWVLGAAMAAGYAGIFLIELAGRLGICASRHQATTAGPAPIYHPVEQEAA